MMLLTLLLLLLLLELPLGGMASPARVAFSLEDSFAVRNGTSMGAVGDGHRHLLSKRYTQLCTGDSQTALQNADNTAFEMVSLVN
jgi:hypothetical protein